MEIVFSVLEYLKSDPALAMFAALFAVSEALALIPALKDNSVLQVVGTVLKKLANKPWWTRSLLLVNLQG
jgi:hypothetical protein